MPINNQGQQRQDSVEGQRATPGWTTLHSWAFLAILAVGLTLVVFQNRYHYLSPLGLGKAYRIDKIFGGIQEFEPSQGWVTAQLQMMGPGPMSAMPEPPGAPTEAVPMQMPGGRPGAMLPPSPGAIPEALPVPAAPEQKAIPTPSALREPTTQEALPRQEATPRQAEMTRDEKMKTFLKMFPEYGEEEFQLASDDLYPDWKKRVAPDGAWNDFLRVYGEFIQWWTDAGAPPEPGLNLWSKFLATKKR